MLKREFFSDCSKMFRCKALEILRSEAYLDWTYVATTKDERNAADGCFSTV
jgi:hypothetical protein